MKKCYCCGADVPDQSKFCPKCGKPMAVTQDLIDRAKANNPDAQTELYERTYKTVYSRIRAKVPDSDTVMDIMQESYLRAFTSLDQLQKAETFPSWILTIANRQVCDWYKKNGKESENVQMSQLEYENDDTISDEDDLLEMPEYREDFSPDESLDRAETGRLLSEILDTLPEDQRIILTMRYYDEMSLQEISDELGVNLSTVKSRLTAGKKKVEAKVLELEKSGTKLYSLGPMAFLVYLLHHAELFAPAISANTVIGLTTAGMGTAAGGAAISAAGVTGKAAAGAAVKAAGGAAAKGLGVKIAAVAAAVVVAGGVTAGVVTLNNNVVEEEKTIKSISWSTQEGQLEMEQNYDEKGNLLTQVEYTDGTEKYKYEYVYNDDGSLQTAKIYELGELYLTYVFNNVDGMPVSSTTYVDDNNIRWSSQYVCDSDGNILTSSSYGEDGTIYSSQEYEYDDAGNVLTETSYNLSGDISSQVQYTYDNEGNPMTIKTYQYDYFTGNLSSSYTREYDYTFDETGKILTGTIYQDGKKLYVGTYEYYD